MITVIADDLTGAAEIAGICLRYGIDTSFGIDAVPQKKAPITIIATDSRSMTEEEAYTTHLQLAKEIVANAKNEILFKKCDSVLRGNVVSEIIAISKATNKNKFILQPANPTAKRCIRNGIYWVEENLLENTGFAHDPDFPATTSNVEKRITEKSTFKKDRLKIICGQNSKIDSDGIFIPDCNSKEDLTQAAKLFNPKVILGGSSAFFEQFLIQQGIAQATIEPPKISYSTNYLLLSGSTHTESLRFAKEMETKNCPLLLLPEFLIGEEMDQKKMDQYIAQISTIYTQKHKLTLRISDAIIEFPNSSKILKNRMSFIVEKVLKLANINELFIEGGATAYALLHQLNWNNFKPIAELAPGVVRMQLVSNNKKYITIKPGSYKWPEDLLQ